MKQELIILPNGFPCSLGECEPGFFIHENNLCFKDEYRGAYCDTGEAFWAGTDNEKDRDKIIVQPVVYEWRLFEQPQS